MGTLVRQLRSSWTTGGSLENPANWVARTFGISESSAGENVNEKNALYAVDFLTCVRIISETIAQLPLITYERLERGKQRASKHPLYRVLADQANDEMTAYDFRETLQSHLLTYGNAYAWIEREGNDVVGLWPLLPDRTRAFRGPDKTIWYESQIQKDPAVPADRRIYAASEIFRLHGLSFDGLRGYSVVDLMRESVGLAVAQDKYNGRSLKNNSMPPAIITQVTNMKADERERFIKEWRENHQGPDKAWAIALLAAGMDVKPLGITQRDAQFLELRKFTRAATVGFFRIPPHMLSDTEMAPSGGTGVEARSMDFAKYAIQPWATRWEQQINKDLLLRPRDQRYFSEFLMDGLMRPDSAGRAAYYSQASGKWMTANEIRDKENMNPYEAPEDPKENPGDVLMFPQNMGAAEKVVAADPGAPAPGAADVPGAQSKDGADARRSLIFAHRFALQDIADRILRREVADLSRKKVDEVYADHAKYITRQMLPAMQTLAGAVSGDVAREVGREVKVSDAFLQKYVESYANRHVKASRDEVRSIVDSGADLKAAIVDWPKRAEFVAQHESVRAGNAFAREAYQSVGKSVVWVTGDDCKECAQMRDCVADSDGSFRPGVSHPPLCDNCECLLMSASEPQAQTHRDVQLLAALAKIETNTRDEMKPEERGLLLAMAKRLSEPVPVPVAPKPEPITVKMVVPDKAFVINVTNPPVTVTTPPVNFERGAIVVQAPEQLDTEIVYDKKTGRVAGTKKVR